MNQKGFASIMVVLGILILAGVVGYLVIHTQIPLPIPVSSPTPSFTPLPSPGGVRVSLGEGQREGPLLVEKIYPDRVAGLNFAEYPVAALEGYPVTLHIGESVTNGCTITLTLISIKESSATFIKKTDPDRPCPICLAGNTLIDTPLGSVPVKDLHKGMPIWTITKAGQRVSGVVVETSQVPVPPSHQMVQLILGDGRTLLVSPGHPTADRRTIGELIPNDLYDGARVISVNRIAYNDVATYDILPSGETGFYWADGIRLDSTLHQKKGG